MVTKNKSLAAIFPFELEETINSLLFSGTALEEKPITTMYTDAKVDGHQVDHAASARIITANEVTKTPIGEIDDFPIEVNSIIILIKVLIIKATQYQALIGNDWLSKINVTLDWNIQELQLNQNAMCGHFKPITMPSTPLIEFEEEKAKPTWKEKQREEPTWKATINIWTNNNQSEMPPILNWKEKNKEKGKEREENIPEEPTTTEEITSGWKREYSCEPIKELPYISLKCKDCRKKLSSMGAWSCHKEWYGYLKRQGKWDNKPCLACNKQLFNKEMWNNIPGRGETCDTLSISRLDSYPHNEDEIWQMANTKIEGALPSEILEIKNNSPEPTDIVLVLNLDAFIDLENSPEEFHEHYQNLAPMREEQEQCLEEINT
ncbi:hypothetical protein G9A89_006503 [Geosiphon pyriformis]|nr:hypothetical protein G9A89_006503 [Geosiphon pyriformis]